MEVKSDIGEQHHMKSQSLKYVEFITAINAISIQFIPHATVTFSTRFWYSLHVPLTVVPSVCKWKPVKKSYCCTTHQLVIFFSNEQEDVIRVNVTGELCYNYFYRSHAEYKANRQFWFEDRLMAWSKRKLEEAIGLIFVEVLVFALANNFLKLPT